MAELRKMFGELGFEDASTLLQSGNVVFGSSAEPAVLEKLLEDATEKRFGFRPAYFVRTAKEWDAMIEDNPLLNEAEERPSGFLVVFLRDAPDPAEVEAVAQRITGPETLRGVGRHLYTTYPDGIGRSTIGKTPGFAKLAGFGTARNWNTVIKLRDLLKKD